MPTLNRDFFRSLRSYVRPGASQSSTGSFSVTNGIVIVGLGLTAIGVSAAVRAMRGARTNRQKTLASSITQTITDSSAGRTLDVQPDDVTVSVQQAFGHPSLVTLTFAFGDSPVRDALPTDAAMEALDMLVDTAVQAAWNNPMVAPVSVCVYMAHQGDTGKDADQAGTPDDEAVAPANDTAMTEVQPQPVTSTTEDAAAAPTTTLVFTGNPDELYEHFGSPASDPAWRP